MIVAKIHRAIVLTRPPSNGKKEADVVLAKLDNVEPELKEDNDDSSLSEYRVTMALATTDGARRPLDRVLVQRRRRDEESTTVSALLLRGVRSDALLLGFLAA